MTAWARARASGSLAACPAGVPRYEIPGCGTGPTGRERFVAREIAEVVHALRDHSGHSGHSGHSADDDGTQGRQR
jgi:hypothetical protein